MVLLILSSEYAYAQLPAGGIVEEACLAYYHPTEFVTVKCFDCIVFQGDKLKDGQCLGDPNVGCSTCFTIDENPVDPNTYDVEIFQDGVSVGFYSGVTSYTITAGTHGGQAATVLEFEDPSGP